VTPDDPAAALRRAFALFNEIGIIAQLSRAMFERRLPDGLTLPHFTVVNHLARLGDGRTPGELARAFQTPKASMTNTLAGLERRGLVIMRPDPRDARLRRVMLTEAGRAFREAAILALGPDVAGLADALRPERLDLLLPELTALRQALDAARDPVPPPAT
jgi:DNA-binding MarR family transcriptional regulator